MTATVTANGDARQAAVVEWQARQAEGVELTGAELAQRFGKSPSWGRQVAREARTATAPTVEPAAPGPPLAAPDPAPTASGVQDGTPERPYRGKGVVPSVAAWQRRVTGAAVLVVAVVAAVISYSHMQQLALEAGEGVWQAAMLPLSVDGMMLAASMTALVRKRAGENVGVLPWLALLLGVAASVAANIASAEPTLEGRLIAAWPPVALLVSLEMLLRQVRAMSNGLPTETCPTCSGRERVPTGTADHGHRRQDLQADSLEADARPWPS